MSSWIKIRTSLHNDPKIMSMADSLDVSDVEIIGALVTFWSWADSHTEDGVVRNLSRSRLDRIATINGLSAELVRIGWAEIDENTQEVTLVNFGEHNGNSAKKRATDAKRQSSKRSRINKKSSKSDSCPKSVTLESGQKCDLDKIREDKIVTKVTKGGSSKPKKTETLPFESDAFSEVWQDWKKHRTEIRKKLTPSTIKKQLTELSKQNESDAIASINQSITHGWAGLFPIGGMGGNRKTSDRNAGTANEGRADQYADLDFSAINKSRNASP